jgi:hypothetical protein
MYKFDLDSQSVEASFRAIAIDQLDETLADLAGGNNDKRSVVHEARRRCKKLRGLLRLVRYAFAAYATENDALRVAAGGLSHLRDSEVLRQTVRSLADHEGTGALSGVAERMPEPATSNRDEALADFARQIGDVRGRVEQWTLSASGTEAFLPGFRRTYRDARDRMKDAKTTREPQAFHEWRKANKYHGFHIDLLKRCAPDVLVGPLEATNKLSTLLGAHHDLTVLIEAVDTAPSRFGDETDLDLLRAVARKRRDEIETDAFELGRQVCAERPKAIARRFATYWETVV